MDNALPQCSINTDNGKSSLRGAAIAAQDWYHIAVTWNNVTNLRKIYVNGDFKTSDTKVGGLIDGLGSTSLGRAGQYPSGYLNGAVDEVRIYNRTLSDGEILDHYNMGLAG